MKKGETHPVLLLALVMLLRLPSSALPQSSSARVACFFLSQDAVEAIHSEFSLEQALLAERSHGSTAPVRLFLYSEEFTLRLQSSPGSRPETVCASEASSSRIQSNKREKLRVDLDDYLLETAEVLPVREEYLVCGWGNYLLEEKVGQSSRPASWLGR